MKEDSLIVVERASGAGKVGVTGVAGRPSGAENR
jgi:hypothetical protein